MKVVYNWSVAVLLALPFGWLMAYLLYLHPIISSGIYSIQISIAGILLGLLLGGILADKVKTSIYPLILIEILILLIGIGQFQFDLTFWASITGQWLLFFLFFLFGSGLVLMTVFLNQLVASIRRGRVAGIVSVTALVVSGILSFVWQLTPTSFAPTITAALIVFGIAIGLILRPWKEELQTYLVPGSIGPYLIWWIICLVAFGLFVWATPVQFRHLFNTFHLTSTTPYLTALMLMSVGGATFLFTFLPDRLGRKRVFSIASLMLGVLCIFGSAQLNADIGFTVSLFLLVLQVFVIGFIIGVGVWLVWAEIGPVRMKGRRAAIGWAPLVLLGGSIWWLTILSELLPVLFPVLAFLPSILYPIAASLVLLSLFPLTNAVEVMGNERLVEDIDIRVDSRQVSRALREIEEDTSLKSIEEQLETELAQLTRIRGLTRNQAKLLRDAGYETPLLVSRATIETISQILAVPPDQAAKILASAKKVSIKQTKSSISSRQPRSTKLKPSKARKSTKKRKTK